MIVLCTSCRIRACTSCTSCLEAALRLSRCHLLIKQNNKQTIGVCPPDLLLSYSCPLSKDSPNSVAHTLTGALTGAFAGAFAGTLASALPSQLSKGGDRPRQNGRNCWVSVAVLVSLTALSNSLWQLTILLHHPSLNCRRFSDQPGLLRGLHGKPPSMLERSEAWMKYRLLPEPERTTGFVRVLNEEQYFGSS